MSDLTVMDAMNGAGQDAECAEVLRGEVLRLDDAYAERTRQFRRDWNALRAERDALAARLATLTAAGIVVGDDGAARWHGLTGAEIAGMQRAVTTLRKPVQLWMDVVDKPSGEVTKAWGCRSFGECNDLITRLAAAALEDDDVISALAAVAGRGAEGEAME